MDRHAHHTSHPHHHFHHHPHHLQHTGARSHTTATNNTTNSNARITHAMRNAPSHTAAAPRCHLTESQRRTSGTGSASKEAMTCWWWHRTRCLLPVAYQTLGTRTSLFNSACNKATDTIRTLGGRRNIPATSEPGDDVELVGRHRRERTPFRAQRPCSRTSSNEQPSRVLPQPSEQHARRWLSTRRRQGCQGTNESGSAAGCGRSPDLWGVGRSPRKTLPRTQPRQEDQRHVWRGNNIQLGVEDLEEDLEGVFLKSGFQPDVATEQKLRLGRARTAVNEIFEGVREEGGGMERRHKQRKENQLEKESVEELEGQGSDWELDVNQQNQREHRGRVR